MIWVLEPTKEENNKMTWVTKIEFQCFSLQRKKLSTVTNMASNMDSSINRRCHFIFYCSSSTCQENGSNREAEFYCEECSKTKFFCGICVELHNALFKEHAMFGKENISQWPGPDVVELEQCKEHRKEKLTKFCEDHSQLICQVCHVHNHQ